jgi:hypothetical protein
MAQIIELTSRSGLDYFQEFFDRSGICAPCCWRSART